MRVALILLLSLCLISCGGETAPATTADTAATPAAAATATEFTLTLRDNRFVPAELTVPANTKITLVVVNEDSTPEEFESHELKREKIVTGNGRITVMVGPLAPGRYPFFGEFHMDTAQGVLIAE